MLPDILDKNANKQNLDITDLEKLTKEIIDNLTPVDTASLMAEMTQMTVEVQENPTTFDINKGLAITQGYKDRLAEIYMIAYENYAMRKRCLEMLVDANNLISKGSSADKRKGEATLKYAMQFLNYEYAASFLKQVEQSMTNMKSKMDMFSRQGSMLSLQSQLGEYKANKDGAEELEWGIE